MFTKASEGFSVLVYNCNNLIASVNHREWLSGPAIWCFKLSSTDPVAIAFV